MQQKDYIKGILVKDFQAKFFNFKLSFHLFYYYYKFFLVLPN